LATKSQPSLRLRLQRPMERALKEKKIKEVDEESDVLAPTGPPISQAADTPSSFLSPGPTA
jgi:hypothetical protein